MVVDEKEEPLRISNEIPNGSLNLKDLCHSPSQWVIQPDSPKEWAEFDAPEIKGCAPDRAFLPSEQVNAWTPDSKIVIVYNKFDNERLDDRYTKTSSRPPLIHRPAEPKKTNILHGLGLRIAGLTSLFGLRHAN